MFVNSVLAKNREKMKGQKVLNSGRSLQEQQDFAAQGCEGICVEGKVNEGVVLRIQATRCLH